MAQSFWTQARSSSPQSDADLIALLSQMGSTQAAADANALPVDPTAVAAPGSVPPPPGPVIVQKQPRRKIIVKPSVSMSEPTMPQAQAPAAPHTSGAATGGVGYATPPVGSGIREGTDLTDEQRQVLQAQKYLFMDPSLVRERMAQFSEIPELKAQKKGVDQLKELLAMEAESPLQTNYSHLAGLGDVLTGGKYNLQSSFKAPETADDKLRKIASLQDKAQDNQRDLSRTLIDLAKSTRAGMDTTTNYQDLLKKISEAVHADQTPRQSAGNPVNNYHKWATRTDKTFKDLDTALQHTDALEGMVKSGNPIETNRIPIIRAQIDNHGRPNIQEIKLEGGDPAILSRIDQSLERLASGKLTEHNKELYLQSLRDARDMLILKRKVEARRLQNEGAQYGLSPGQMQGRFSKEYLEGPNGGKQSQAPAAPMNSRDAEIQKIQAQNAEIQAILEKAKGGK